MKPELETQIHNDFPELFSRPMHLEIGDGWYKVLRGLCVDLMAQPKPPKFTQIKEKFGTLRVYLDGYSFHSDRVVRVAEAASAVVCEWCGEPGEMRSGSWLLTLCDSCHVKYVDGYRPWHVE